MLLGVTGSFALLHSTPISCIPCFVMPSFGAVFVIKQGSFGGNPFVRVRSVSYYRQVGFVMMDLGALFLHLEEMRKKERRTDHAPMLFCP